MNTQRTPPKKKARELAKYLRTERPDYPYLKGVFRALRTELEVEVPKSSIAYRKSRLKRNCASFISSSGKHATSPI
jgi:hypothetical protein